MSSRVARIVVRKRSATVDCDPCKRDELEPDMRDYGRVIWRLVCAVAPTSRLATRRLSGRICRGWHTVRHTVRLPPRSAYIRERPDERSAVGASAGFLCGNGES